MSTQRFSESRSYHEESRRNVGNNSNPRITSTTLPVLNTSIDFPRDIGEHRVQERLRHQDTSVRWLNDPSTGQEKFRVTINIEGFQQHEVNIRVEGRKLIVYGEHIENKNQSTAKKIIEKSYELPNDLETSNPHVTFPGLNTMQVDFLSRHSNVIYDNGRNASNLITNYDPPLRPNAGLTQERTSSEYTSTRRIGGGTSYDRNPSPNRYSAYDELKTGAGNLFRTSNFPSTNLYETPSYRSYQDTNYGSSSSGYSTLNNGSSFRPSSSALRGDQGHVYEQSYSETRRETEQRRSSPTSGVQTSRQVEHHRSGSPSLGRALDEERFRTGLNLGPPSITTSPSLSSRNMEVREYSRRIGTGADGSNRTTDLSLFAPGFNSDAFYRSAFQPKIVTDERGQRIIEMQLDVHNYQPSEIKVSVNGNDLIVQAEHKDERPPTSSARAFFYKQITLPPNTDLSTLSSEYILDGILRIKAKFLPEQASIRYN